MNRPALFHSWTSVIGPWSFLLALALGLAGCRPATPTTVGPGTASHAARGVIREFPTDGQSVVIRHEEIPGYMPKMTMTLTVRDTNELAGLREGDEVTFRLHVTDDNHWIDELAKTGQTNAPAEHPKPIRPLRADLRPGDLLPDFELLDEQGRTVRLADFRGKALAFTFIFTRCPLPEFCPRMTKHFARTRNELLTRTNAPANWQLLSLSFDPDFDSPAVLTRYAKSARGVNPDRWLFGVLGTNVLARLAPQVDLMLNREGGSISHNLRTAVVDPKGRIHRQFDGNDWTPEELADAVIAAAQVP